MLLCFFYFRSNQVVGRSRYQPFHGHDNHFWGQFRSRGLGLGRGNQTLVPSGSRGLGSLSHRNTQQVNTKSNTEVSRQKKSKEIASALVGSQIKFGELSSQKDDGKCSPVLLCSFLV